MLMIVQGCLLARPMGRQQASIHIAVKEGGGVDKIA